MNRANCALNLCPEPSTTFNESSLIQFQASEPLLGGVVSCGEKIVGPVHVLLDIGGLASFFRSGREVSRIASLVEPGVRLAEIVEGAILGHPQEFSGMGFGIVRGCGS